MKLTQDEKSFLKNEIEQEIIDIKRDLKEYAHWDKAHIKYWKFQRGAYEKLLRVITKNKEKTK